jgi:hypothetical protein
MATRLAVQQFAARTAFIAVLLAAATTAAQAQEPLPWQRSQNPRADDAYRPPSDAYRSRDDAYRPPARVDDSQLPPVAPIPQAGPVDNYRSGRGYTSAPPSSGGYGQPYSPGPAANDYDDERDDRYDRSRPPARSAYNDRGPRRYDGPPPVGDGTYSQGEITAAGHRFFGSISQGLASVIEYAFQRSGRPNGYVLGEDAGGAFVAGLRYGEGVLYTKDAGNHKVYWQGPSLGYDFGAEGSKTMVLVYNLRDPSEIYNRFGGIQGSAYVIGGVSIQFQKHGDVVLAPIRSGVGLRLGANVGYLKYTRSPTWNPF